MDYLQFKELYHHGIKGQRWGVRRFQNEDGSLTAAGRDRYDVDDVTGETSDRGRARLQKDHDKAIRKLQKQAHKEDPTRRKESTGKNWDETYERMNKEIEKYKNNEKSIFDSAKSTDDITNIFNEEYLTASLKDLEVKNVEATKKLFAHYQDKPLVMLKETKNTSDKETITKDDENKFFNSKEAEPFRKEFGTALDKRVKDYMRDHPNSNLNYNRVEDMFYDDMVDEYITKMKSNK